MKRLLLAPLIIALSSPLQAESIPKISDWDAELNWPMRVVFKCPVQVTYEIENGRREKITKKLYPECWADFYQSYIDIMDRQLIEEAYNLFLCG